MPKGEYLLTAHVFVAGGWLLGLSSCLGNLLPYLSPCHMSISGSFPEDTSVAYLEVQKSLTRDPQTAAISVLLSVEVADAIDFLWFLVSAVCFLRERPWTKKWIIPNLRLTTSTSGALFSTLGIYLIHNWGEKKDTRSQKSHILIA